MSYSTINIKPDYMKKLEKIIKKSKVSKVAQIEILIDKKLEELKNNE